MLPHCFVGKLILYTFQSWKRAFSCTVGHTHEHSERNFNIRKYRLQIVGNYFSIQCNEYVTNFIKGHVVIQMSIFVKKVIIIQLFVLLISGFILFSLAHLKELYLIHWINKTDIQSMNNLLHFLLVQRLECS